MTMDWTSRLRSLQRWAWWCETAGVPFLPADFGPIFPTRGAFAYYDGCAVDRDTDDAIRWLGARLATQTERHRLMVRWDQCAPTAVHTAPHAWQEAFAGLDFTDTRPLAYHHGPTTQFVVRPWHPLRPDRTARVIVLGDAITVEERYEPIAPWLEETAHAYAVALRGVVDSPVGFYLDVCAPSHYPGTVVLHGGPLEDLCSPSPR
jgi:hypothetical protein